MNKQIFKLSQPIIIFGNGETPDHPVALKVLKKASTIISLDGGSDKLIQMGYLPDYIVGDMDSLKENKVNYEAEMILMKDQSKTDLEKAIDWLGGNKINKLELIACSAGRDDHYFANIFILEKFSNVIDLKMITNWSIFYFLDGLKTFKSEPGQIISIIAKNRNVKITTVGLKYNLKNETLKFPSQGISNVSLGSSFSLDVSKPVWVIINHI